MAICGKNQRQVKALFFTHLCMHESIYLAIYSSPFPLLSPPQGLSNFLKDCQEDASFPLQLNPVSRVALFRKSVATNLPNQHLTSLTYLDLILFHRPHESGPLRKQPPFAEGSALGFCTAVDRKISMTHSVVFYDIQQITAKQEHRRKRETHIS